MCCPGDNSRYQGSCAPTTGLASPISFLSSRPRSTLCPGPGLPVNGVLSLPGGNKASSAGLSHRSIASNKSAGTGGCSDKGRGAGGTGTTPGAGGCKASLAVVRAVLLTELPGTPEQFSGEQVSPESRVALLQHSGHLEADKSPLWAESLHWGVFSVFSGFCPVGDSSKKLRP